MFEEAMSAVVVMMDTNFSAAFKRTPAYKQLENNVLKEAAELDRLSKVWTAYRTEQLLGSASTLPYPPFFAPPLPSIDHARLVN